uniref:Coiled-coil_56 domain-containing protein n=1 Tax=Elaeophora elaphi TaxID=1147741 RepID=A0A0R3S0A1_9BILA
MGDKYVALNAYPKGDIMGTPAVSDVPLPGSPAAADVTPLLDQEVEVLRSVTDLYSKKFEPEKEKMKVMSRKLTIMIYVGAMALSVIAFNIGIVIGYYAL